MRKETQVKTKRMLLSPLSDGEIEVLMEKTDSAELREAYGEMLSGCKRDPENRIWYAPWKMTRKSDNTFLGDLCFKGPARENAVYKDQHRSEYEILQHHDLWIFQYHVKDQLSSLL